MGIEAGDHGPKVSQPLTRRGRAAIIDLAAEVRPPAGVGPEWFQDLVAAWSRALARKGRSPKTQRTYLYAMRGFGRWLEHCRVQAPEHVVLEVLHSWQDSMVDRLAARSQVVHANAVRGLLRWAARERLGIPAGLWEHVDTPRTPEPQPRALEPEELAKVLRHYAPPGGTLERLRDRALFLFLLTTGSRIGAALSLDREQAKGPLVIRQKGGSQHTLVPSTTARAWLQHYLERRGRDEVAALWIRIGPRRRRRLGQHEANVIWRELCAGLRIRTFTNHALRHTAATELGEHGVSDTELASHLGWSSNAMAMTYRELRAGRRQEMVNLLDELIPAVAAARSAPARGRRSNMAIVRGRRTRG